MKILYIYRNKSLGFSIAKVFRPIEEEMRKYAEVDNFYLPEAGAKPWQLLKNIQSARRKIATNKYDIVHITGSEHYLIPFLKGSFKIIVTVHDLGFFTNANFTLRTMLLYLLWIKTLKIADKVICISEKTKGEVLQFVKIRPNRICTIYNPVGKEFIYSKHTFNTSCPVILHIGTKPNKNLTNTIIALQHFPHKLRIIGRLTTEQEALLNTYSPNYSNAFNLTDEEMVHEYELCDIVNFPSFYEGFGMPIIEGQAVGRLVITSDLPPMNEIAGTGAVLVNPADCNSILEGYKKAIKNYKQIIEAGLYNVKRYNIEEIVKAYYRVYYEFENVMK